MALLHVSHPPVRLVGVRTSIYIFNIFLDTLSSRPRYKSLLEGALAAACYKYRRLVT